ncbi:DUF938 domain-containing protein [Marinomonas sp. 2405UD68-3]|uniref:DUF938 domain-containing protein n=1 Tax=Marinomonas sp. 2405UD68-3 TaxID=3391835 RepID=UPI0039C8C7EA
MLRDAISHLQRLILPPSFCLICTFLSIEFLFGQNDWPSLPINAIFTASTTHIMQREEAKLMMQQIGVNLNSNGVFCQYEPMNVNGNYTSDGNRNFDQHLLKNGYGVTK